MVPSPVPAVADVIVRNGDAVAAVQAHAGAETVKPTLPVPPPAPTALVGCVKLAVHPLDCVTVNVSSSIVIVPTRAGPTFAANV